MSDEKDRFGQKLHDVGKAREDQWARDEDEKRIQKLRERQTIELHCPQCHGKLGAEVEAGLAVMACPHGHGVWMDKVTLQQLIKSRS
jgi:TFIIB-like protein